MEVNRAEFRIGEKVSVNVYGRPVEAIVKSIKVRGFLRPDVNHVGTAGNEVIYKLLGVDGGMIAIVNDRDIRESKYYEF